MKHTEDQGFMAMIRDMLDRLKKLETSQNNSVKRNDIRLSDLVVTGDADNMRLCLENLNTHEVRCLTEAQESTPTQAQWSFSGDLTSGDEGSFSPTYLVERTTIARQIIVARPYNASFTGTVSVCVHFKGGDIIITADLASPSAKAVKEINVPLVENDDIVIELTDAGTSAENISVFVRFGTPTAANASITDCFS